MKAPVFNSTTPLPRPLGDVATVLPGCGSVASAARQGVQLPINNRTVFLDINSVRASRGISAFKVNELVEAGELLWVFNVSQIHDGRHARNLRFWFPEIIDARVAANLELDGVISKILPASRRSFNGSEMGQWFMVSPNTVQCIGHATRGVVKNGLLYVQRERLVEWLRQRWIGSATSKRKPSAT